MIRKPFGFIRRRRLDYIGKTMSPSRENERIIPALDNMLNIDKYSWSPLVRLVDWKKLGLRVIFFLASSAWFAIFPVYLFVIYMYERGFFSYEFFVDGVIGLKSFFLVFMVLMVLVSVYLYGFMLLSREIYVTYIKKGFFSWWMRFLLWVSLIVAAFTHLLIFYFSLSIEAPSIYWTFSVTCFVFVSYVCSFIGKSRSEGATNWIPSAMFLFVSFSLPIFNTENVALAMETGLKKFNVGAGKNVSLYHKVEEVPFLEGKLLLWAPEFVYVESFNEGKRLIHAYPTKHSTHIVVEQ